MDNEQLGMVIGIAGAVLIIAGLGLNLTGGLVESEGFFEAGYISGFDTPSTVSQGGSMNVSFKSKITDFMDYDEEEEKFGNRSDSDSIGNWVIKVGTMKEKTESYNGEEYTYYKPEDVWGSKSFYIDDEEESYDFNVSVPSDLEPGDYKIGIWSEDKGGFGNYLVWGDPIQIGIQFGTTVLPKIPRYRDLTVEEKAEDEFTVTLKQDGNGAVSGGGVYEKNETITITASPDSGWKFDGWTEDIETSGSDSDYTFTVDEDVTTTAVFKEKDSTDDYYDDDDGGDTDEGERDQLEKYVLSVQKEPNWGGTIEETGESGEEKQLYEEGTKVAVEVSTNPNFKFTGWTGDISSDSKTVSVTMDSDKDITATFEEMTQKAETYNLTIKINGEGMTNPPEGIHSYDYGEVPTIEANPDEGYVFDGWNDGSSESTKSVVMDDNKTMTANFRPKSADEVTLTMITSPSEGGSINLTHAETVTLDKGETIQLEAFSNEGYAFERWDVGAESFQDKHITYVIEEDTTATAHFNEKESPVEILKKYLGWILTGGGVVLIGGAFFVAKML